MQQSLFKLSTIGHVQQVTHLAHAHLHYIIPQAHYVDDKISESRF